MSPAPPPPGPPAPELAPGISGEMFRGLLESAPDGILVVDEDGRIVLVNTQAERLFGYPRGELLGRPVEVLVPDRFRAEHPGQRAEYARAPRVRPMGGGRVLHARRRDGSELPVEISLSPLAAADRRLVISAVRDVSDRVRTEQALREQNDALERASRAKDRFLATMSHELRTPLNAIIGFTGTLLMRLPGPLTPDQERQLRTVQTSARHLLALINDLLDLAKIESGKVELRPEPVGCADAVREVEAALRPAAEAKGLAFEAAAPPGLAVRADRRALCQVLLNLVGNAVKFTDAGAIRLAVEPAAGAVRFRISDTGIGITPDDRARLFAPFVRVDTPGRRAEGTGLGLHLSRRLAELLGGTVGCESEPGRGSTFTLTLPEA